MVGWAGMLSVCRPGFFKEKPYHENSSLQFFPLFEPALAPGPRGNGVRNLFLPIFKNNLVRPVCQGLNRSYLTRKPVEYSCIF